MAALKELTSKEDLDFLIKEFYKEAMSHEQIGHFFTEDVQLDLVNHLPKIAAFWSDILFGSKQYKSNPMQKHIELHAISPLRKEDFAVWLSLWKKTLNEHFIGAKAEEAIARAENIAAVMQYKLSQ
ncbi:MAG: group III truncated hemoglobin [Chitinophagales bacterium]|nr:group III truncated hemoglobin [Chitinophagales bacterium]